MVGLCYDVCYGMFLATREVEAMRKSPLKRISDKKRQQILDERLVRIALAERCGGKWIPENTLTGGYCKGGRCEICGGLPTAPDFRLHPHEDNFRSRGGKMTLMNSRMACNKCHGGKHGERIVDSEPQWGKGGL